MLIAHDSLQIKAHEDDDQQWVELCAWGHLMIVVVLFVLMDSRLSIPYA
jgi:hypothetical protein